MSDNLPGEGLFGWFGRQVGYVKKAVKTKPAPALPPKRSAPQSKPVAPPPPADKPADAPADAIVYRHNEVQEAEHPTQPGVKLRRTIIDEVIVDDPTPPRGNQ